MQLQIIVRACIDGIDTSPKNISTDASNSAMEIIACNLLLGMICLFIGANLKISGEVFSGYSNFLLR